MTITGSAFWQGNYPGTEPIALVVFSDAVTSPDVIPTPSLIVAKNTAGILVIPPQDLGSYVRDNATGHFICHDAGKVHCVLHHHLVSLGDPDAQQVLWNHVAAGRF